MRAMADGVDGYKGDKNGDTEEQILWQLNQIRGLGVLFAVIFIVLPILVWLIAMGADTGY